MTVKEFAASEGISKQSVSEFIQKGMPHTPAKQIDIDPEVANEWRKESAKRTGRPRKNPAA